MSKFIHADLIAQYAQDANECEQPWLRWQFLVGGVVWSDANAPFAFHPGGEYRRKPRRTININGYEVPEPVREPLGECWLADFNYGKAYKCLWDGKSPQPQWLAAGLLHSTKEAAQIHIDAMLSFTRRCE